MGGIGQPNVPLRGEALGVLKALENAWLLINDDRISSFGSHHANPPPAAEQHIDCSGRIVLPAFCDSHTHLVFAQSREQEFVDKINGLSYAEIAARGGGIHASARHLAAMPEEELYQLSMTRLQAATASGTGAIEIKSGYGLTVEAELKMLRVIKRLKTFGPLPVKATFLGAHAIPPAYQRNRHNYISLIINEMLPAIHAEQLADYIDVFCEQGFFTPEETIQIGEAGKKIGLIPKIHANQLHVSGGVEAGIQLGARSVDHLESMNDAAITALAASNTIGTLLPTAAFFLRMAPPPARALINAGAALALASDFNPGSSPSYRMMLVVAMACIQAKMTPAEAINAATINGAFAMDMATELGSIHPGKKASLIITRPVPSLAYLPYAFGNDLIEQVYISGRPVNSIF